MTDATEPDGGSPAPILAARALAAPATVDRLARTVEVVWSTGARARNFVPPLGPILEELDMAPAAVDDSSAAASSATGGAAAGACCA